MRKAAVFRPSIVALLTLFAHAVLGGVVLDGSFGTSGPLPGPNYTITSGMGKLVNTNLFQSFSQFNLISSESATFTGPASVHNILARVTGGSASSIDGTIHSDIAGANLFFMNPAGVLFGQHAQLDVSGSFAVTTANYLKLVGGGRFNANLGGGDVLTSAPVSAFGFLNAAPAPISVTGSTLNVAQQKSFSAVAGDITMNGGTISGEGSRANLVSVKSPGEVGLDATNINGPIDVTHFTAMGTIDLTNFTVNTNGPGGGPVVVRGGNFYLNNSQISSETTGSIDGGGIDISANSILIQDSSFSTVTNGDGNGGDVTLTANSLLSFLNGKVYADTGGKGNGGDVTLTANSIVIDSTFTLGSVIEASTTFGDLSTDRHGNGGNIALTADSILIQGSSVIDTNSVSSAGNAGNITLTANSLLMEGDDHSSPVIESSAGGTVGDGNGGNVTVTANSVMIGPFAAIAAQTFGAGDAGSILVSAGTLQFKEGGFISLSTVGTGAGGSITVLADSVLIDGGAGTETGGASSFSTGIFARAEGSTGKGGDITVTANDLVLLDGGAISTESFVSAAAGSVRLDVGTLSLESGSVVSSANVGSGPAGSVFIQATGAIKLNGASSISTLADVGDAGSIDIISGGEIKLTGQSSITASAGANGGNITITAPDLVYLLDSSITATAGTSGASGTGGNITIDPQFIVLNNSLISANAAAGQGGNINLISDFFFNSNSSITATGTTNGTVNITAPALDLGAQLITLPTSLLSAESQLQERCSALLQGDFSSFISIGRGGTEPAPEELQTTF